MGSGCEGDVKQGQLLFLNLAYGFKKRSTAEPVICFQRKFET